MEPFMGEVRMMAFDFAPKGWAQCDGQFLAINQNQALYALIGTSWGGDGRVNFQLPDLRGRTVIHAGASNDLATRGGEAAHTITQSELPMHTHLANASGTDGNTNLPGGNVLATAANVYGPAASLTTLATGTVANVGGSQAHTNLQPYLPITFCIALQGFFPSRA